jgi:hypothetical protein
MKIYVTKYALTKGIQVYDATSFNDEPKMVRVDGADGTYREYFHKPDWHETRLEAIEHAQKMKLAKIKNLEKQLAKIKALEFV